MAAIDKINPATPYWKITPKGEKQKDNKDHEQAAQNQQKNSNEQEADDGHPHVDDYA